VQERVHASTGRDPSSSLIGSRSLPRRSQTPLWPLRVEATKAERMSVRLPRFTSTETPRLVCWWGVGRERDGTPGHSIAHSAPLIVGLPVRCQFANYAVRR
jgi:hypothetical protein